MEFEGVVLQVLPEIRTQTKSGNEFVKQEVVFEQKGDFARKICVSFTGERVATAAMLKPGERVKVNITIDAREWNGRWFNDIRAWRVDRIINQSYTAAPQQTSQPYAPQPVSYPTYSQPAPSQPMEAQPAPQSSTPEESDDLPF